MVSSASASSLANACSSSYSPGRPKRSSRILPDPAQPETQKMKMMREMRMMEPKEETRPMMTPVKADEADDVVDSMVVCEAPMGVECGVGWIGKGEEGMSA